MFDCPPAWNDHLGRVNDFLRVRKIPLLIDELDRDNKDVCYSEVRERNGSNFMKFMCLGNDVLNVDLAKEKHEALFGQSGGEDAVFVTKKHVTFVSKDVWFQIGRDVVFSKNSMVLSDGMNLLPQNAML